MFDIAPTELLLVAVVALLVIGPKDLPRAMRFVGQWVAKARGVTRHFRSGIDEMIRQAELEEMEKKWAAENARIMAEHPPEPVAPPASPIEGEMTRLGDMPHIPPAGVAGAHISPEQPLLPLPEGPTVPTPAAPPAKPVGEP